MAVKFNKDLLLKHKFWILLGLTLPLACFALFTLTVSVPELFAKDRKNIEDELKKIATPAKPSDLKNEEMIALITKQASELQKQESEVWKDAYKAQEEIYKWHEEVEKEFEFTNGFFAYEIKIDTSGKKLTEFPPDKVPGQAPPPSAANQPGSPPPPPATGPNLIHGKVLQVTKDYLILQDRLGKKHKIYRTAKVNIPSEQKEKDRLFFNNIRPDSVVAIQFEKSLYFSEPLTDSQQKTYGDNYKKQIPPIIERVDPMTRKGEGVVQLRGWDYEKGELPPTKNTFFHYLARDWIFGQDISEDVWILQEDLWIQDEIYRLIRQANDYVSKFKGEGGKDLNKPYIFSNPYWELTLQWPGQNKLVVHMKNLLPRRQRLDFYLMVRMNSNPRFAPEKIFVPGEPLNPKGMDNSSRTVEIPLQAGVTRNGIFNVEQVLTWETAAVRRIDNVSFGKMGEGISESHRTYPDPMVPYKAAPAGAPGIPGSAGAPPGGSPPGSGPGPGSELGKGPGIGIGAPNLTLHDLPRERYLAVTKQLRRIPVAVSLIVEQDHVDRVQSSFNNSRLRFLTTQVLVSRFPGSLRPQYATTDTTGGSGSSPPEFRGSGSPPYGTSSGSPPSGTPGGPAGVSDEMETNVELVIYGIMTIYEKYPPRTIEPRPETKS